MDNAAVLSPKVTWIFIFVILYWSYSIFWGVRGAAQARSAEDYFLAGRNLPYAVFILAALATAYSGWTFLSQPGQIYRDGLQYAYASFDAIAIPFAGVLLFKRQWLLGKHFGFITPGEMLAYYFRSDVIRLLVVLVALFFSVPYVGLQMRAAGYLFYVLSDGTIGAEFGMWVLSVVLISYVASGGLRSVAYADLLQAVLLTLGVVLIGVLVLYFVGGWERLTAGLAAISEIDAVRTEDDYSHYITVPGLMHTGAEDSQAMGGEWTSVMVLTYLVALTGIQASPAFAMWAMASRSPAPFAPLLVWVSFTIGLLLILTVTIQGIGGHLLGADAVLVFHHPDLVQPLMTTELRGVHLLAVEGGQETLVPRLINLVGSMAPWLVGLLAICALAAMESTAACYMATAGGILTRDLFRRFLMPNASDRTQKFVGRLCVMSVVLLALSVATVSTDALILLGGLAVSYGAQMWPAWLGACYWPFITRQGVAVGLVAGLAAVTLTEPIAFYWFGVERWGVLPLTLHSAGWGLLCNLGLCLLVSLLTRDDAARKTEFHRLLQKHSALPASKRRWIPLAWALGLLWLLLIGPGALLGNTVFGDPNQPESWLLGIPSLWVWQWLGWVTGLGLLWFLAYYLELARPSVGTSELGKGSLKSDGSDNA